MSLEEAARSSFPGAAANSEKINLANLTPSSGTVSAEFVAGSSCARPSRRVLDKSGAQKKITCRERAATTSAWGSIKPVAAIVALEDPGPWGPQAPLVAADSRLPAPLLAALHGLNEQGARVLLMRHPGTKPQVPLAQRTLLVAGPTWLWRVQVPADDSGGLERIEIAQMGDAGAAYAHLDEIFPRQVFAPEPQLLVCTHARRDVCCAVAGRPVALAGAKTHPKQTWECTHLGGHRFAGTALVLPSGHGFARLQADHPAQILQAVSQGHLPAELLNPVHDRCGSFGKLGGQIAIAAVREQQADTRLYGWKVSDLQDFPVGNREDSLRWKVRVDNPDGERFLVKVYSKGQRLADSSCGEPAATNSFTASVHS